ncbi:CPXCG motif-containing cysteine-rich protein [Gammaproteobacteria bacterium AB-CW1]|uniref:CPXCG motif-containing cysteine-rich protein n=1 Tax=Natronospira elongata TaxID=3110268 RepID=A0AAP6JFL9_9GAMM|nr:CPXCG motif-containing cysteine-rich protein [Gammaproteobacteria bacterium AB-CW1]
MSSKFATVSLQCPWCLEAVEIFIDADAEAGQWMEDCPVCCHPMNLEAQPDGSGGWQVTAERAH